MKFGQFYCSYSCTSIFTRILQIILQPIPIPHKQTQPPLANGRMWWSPAETRRTNHRPHRRGRFIVEGISAAAPGSAGGDCLRSEEQRSHRPEGSSATATSRPPPPSSGSVPSDSAGTDSTAQIAASMVEERRSYGTVLNRPVDLTLRLLRVFCLGRFPGRISPCLNLNKKSTRARLLTQPAPAPKRLEMPGVCKLAWAHFSNRPATRQ